MDNGASQAAIDQARALLAGAKRLLCITGAGISADSGLPTYRGIGGLYEDGPTEDGMPIEQALSGQMLHTRPATTWKYLAQVESACRGAGFNAGHRALADFQDQCEVCVLTQNIDGFHRQAGSRNVIEIHGCFDRLYCMQCGRDRQVESYAGLTVPPPCDACDGILRPDVVLFGEMLPATALSRLASETALGFDAVLSVGTTSVFPYIAAPVLQARQQGVPTIEINPGQSEVSGYVDLRIKARAAEVLPDILTRA